MLCVLQYGPENILLEAAKIGIFKIKFTSVHLSYVVTVKSTVEISQNFVAISEYMNLKSLR